MFSFFKPYLDFAKKAFFIITVYFIVVSLFFHFIDKDKTPLSFKTDPIKQNRVEIYKVINDKELAKTQQGRLSIALYKITMCVTIGEACTKNPNDADKNYSKSIFGSIGNLIVLPYSHPPASGIAWVSDGLQQAGFMPKAMAAEGIGFAAIQPFSNMWKIFRDVAYMLLVVILIAIGFMIMFRAKINPQTIISVENSLPKIVMSLILITFSFAIAGFMIDLMYVLIILIISILSKNDVVHINVQEYQSAILGGTAGGGAFMFGKLNGLWGVGTQHSIGTALLSLFPPAIRIVISVAVTTVMYFLLQLVPFINQLSSGEVWKGIAETGGVLKTIWQGVSFPIWLGIAGLLGPLILGPFIITLLVWFTIVFLLFRIIFMLFKAFLELIILIIFAPILLMFEAIPGMNVFTWWIKNIVGDLIPFPLVVLFVIISNIMTEMSSKYSYWSPPLLPGSSPEFSVIIGVGLLFLIPDFVKLIKEAIGIKPLPIQIGLGTFFGGAGAAVGGATGLIGQIGSFSLGLSAITGKDIGTMVGIRKPLPGGGQTNVDKADQEKAAKGIQG